MAKKISSLSELLHRFHACELSLRQGKVASCLVNFKDIVEQMPGISMLEKEKKEIYADITAFLNNLSAHKKFKEIFGEFSFADTDLDTNLDFIKSMITAQEQEIMEKVGKDEEAAEAQRLEIIGLEEKRKEEIKQKIEEAIKAIDEGNLPQAREIMKDSEEILDGVVLHYNTLGMQNRETKNFAEAVDNYNKAISVATPDENLQYNIARAYFEDGKLDKAERCLEKALKFNPEFKEGKEFYDYLLKVDQANAGSGGGKKSGGFFKKLFSFLQRKKSSQ